MIRIGVMDEEEGYVSKLTAYLNRVNKGTMQCCAFTKKEGILTGLKDHRWDVLAATDRAFVEEMLEESGLTYHMIGDAHEIGNIKTAITEAYNVTKDL